MGTISIIHPRSIAFTGRIARFFIQIVSLWNHVEQRQKDRVALRHLADDPRLLADVGLSRNQILTLLKEDRL